MENEDTLSQDICGVGFDFKKYNFAEGLFHVNYHPTLSSLSRDENLKKEESTYMC